MYLLAFDQALHKTGWAQIEFNTGKVYRYGVLTVPAKYTGFEAFKRMVDEITDAAILLDAKCIAIEQVHHRRNTKTLIQLAQLSGALLWHFSWGGYGLVEVSSAEVMAYLNLPVGTGRKLKKERARIAATRAIGKDPVMLGDDELVPSDEADAIIIGKIACEKLGIDTPDNQDYTDNSVK